jgi:hypothetical protein
LYTVLTLGQMAGGRPVGTRVLLTAPKRDSIVIDGEE